MESVTAKTDEHTCAVMIEYVQGEGGVLPLDPAFVKALGEYCREKDILLIADEVQTGVGRTGSLYCWEQYGVKPDILTSAKRRAAYWCLSLHRKAFSGNGQEHARFHLRGQSGGLRRRPGGS